MAYEEIPVVSGGSDGFGSGGWWAIILFAMIFGWGGNGFGGRSTENVATNGDLQRGLDTMSINNKIDSLVTATSSNFATIVGEIKENKYETRLAIQEINNSIQSCCCSMKQEMNANTQRLVDLINEKTTSDLKEKIAEYSQAKQTADIIAALKTTSTTTS